MALVIALRHMSKIHNCSLSSKYLSASYKNVTTLSALSSCNGFILNDGCKQFTNRSKASILPVVRHMSSDDHRTLWKVERAVSVSLLGLLPACIIYPCEILNNMAAIAVVAHFHWGLEAIARDYVRKIIFGPIIPKIAVMLVYVVSATTLGGLLFFNFTDIGIGCAIRQFWAIQG